jgi:hypothetical protein
MLRVVTDPQPEPDGPGEEPGDEQGFLDLLGSVRNLAWIVGPAAPRSVVQDAAEVRLAVAPGAEVSLGLRLENRQQTAAPVVPLLSAFRSADGRVWTPGAAGRLVVVPPGQASAVTLEFGTPAPADPGVYEGSVQLLGADGGGVRVVVEVAP